MSSPVIITSRLLPGIRIGGAEIHVEPTDRTSGGKPRWRWIIDLPDGTTHEDTDLCGWGDAGAMLGTLLSFLDACAESRRYRGDNSDLFPDAVGEWAEQWSDEIRLA